MPACTGIQENAVSELRASFMLDALLCSYACFVPFLVWLEGFQHGVGGGITNGEKPGTTTGVVIPPLFLDPGFVLARVQVVSPFV